MINAYQQVDRRLAASFNRSLPHSAASSGTEQHWREIRGVRPSQKDWAKANQACCRRISTRWSTRNGLARDGLGSAHERGSEVEVLLSLQSWFIKAPLEAGRCSSIYWHGFSISKDLGPY
jgi:hypothetical protein